MDAAALVHAVLLDGAGGGRRLTPDEAAAWQPAQGLLWLHLDYTHPDTPRWLAQMALPALVSDAMLAQETRPRAAPMRDGTLVYLRGVNLTPGAHPEDMIAIRLWLTQTCIVSTQRRPLGSVADMLEDLAQGNGPGDTWSLLVDLTDRLTWYMEDVVDQVEEQIATYEEVAMVRQSRGLRNEIARVRRRVSILRRYLAPQRDALARLLDSSGPLADAERGRLREVMDRLQRLLEDLDAAREHANIAQEDLANRLADELNRRMYVLAIFSVVFLPLTFLTGLLGVNLEGIPEAESELAFPVFVLMLVVVGGGIVAVLRRRGWL
ncbi:zinc transporter ZntB [Isoalcanivorax indicus]|uniref:zinc transporter ZntB n=1 Tax=Isoalcanivorax indicus TaxID=2202653 RepID=UPI000DB931CD|nr:zinc transporter ZntB [Isoalcanivorax indicus]